MIPIPKFILKNYLRPIRYLSKNDTGDKLFKYPGNLKTHWLVPYIVEDITNRGVVKLQKLDGTIVRGLVKGSRLNPFHDSNDLVT